MLRDVHTVCRTAGSKLGPATGHLDTGFRVFERTLRRFSRFQVATAAYTLKLSKLLPSWRRPDDLSRRCALLLSRNKNSAALKSSHNCQHSVTSTLTCMLVSMRRTSEQGLGSIWQTKWCSHLSPAVLHLASLSLSLSLSRSKHEESRRIFSSAVQIPLTCNAQTCFGSMAIQPNWRPGRLTVKFSRSVLFKLGYAKTC